MLYPIHDVWFLCYAYESIFIQRWVIVGYQMPCVLYMKWKVLQRVHVCEHQRYKDINDALYGSHHV